MSDTRTPHMHRAGIHAVVSCSVDSLIDVCVLSALPLSLDTTTLDYTKVQTPVRVNLQTGEILLTTTKVFEFTVDFPKVPSM